MIRNEYQDEFVRLYEDNAGGLTAQYRGEQWDGLEGIDPTVEIFAAFAVAVIAGKVCGSGDEYDHHLDDNEDTIAMGGADGSVDVYGQPGLAGLRFLGLPEDYDALDHNGEYLMGRAL